MTLEIRNIDGKGRGGRRRKQLPNDLAEKRGYRQLKEEALDRTLWRKWHWILLWACRDT
jgi:hypothetical protein